MNNHNNSKGVIHVPLFPRQGGQVPVSEQNRHDKQDRPTSPEISDRYSVSPSSDAMKSKANGKYLSSRKSSFQVKSTKDSEETDNKGLPNALPGLREKVDDSYTKGESNMEKSYYTRPPIVRQYSYNSRRGGTPRQWLYDTQNWGNVDARGERKIFSSKYDANKRVPRAKASSKIQREQGKKTDMLNKDEGHEEMDDKVKGYSPSQYKEGVQRGNSEYSYRSGKMQPYRISPLEYESLGRNLPENIFGREEYNFKEPEKSVSVNKQQNDYHTGNDFYFTKEPNIQGKDYGPQKSQQHSHDSFSSGNKNVTSLGKVDNSEKKGKSSTILGEAPPPPPLKNSKWTPHPPIKKSSESKQKMAKENKTLASKSQNNFRRTYFSRRHYPYLRFKRNAISYHGNARSKRSLRDFIATTDHMTLVLDHATLEDEALYECQVKPLGGPAHWGRSELQVHGK